MTTAGGVVLATNADNELYAHPSPPPPPSQPTEYRSLYASQDFNVPGANVEVAVQELLSVMAEIERDLRIFLVNLTNATATVTTEVFSLVNNSTYVDVSRRALELRPRRLQDGGCVGGARLKVSIVFDTPVLPEVVSSIQSSWADIANFNSTRTSQCGEVDFDPLPWSPLPEGGGGSEEDPATLIITLSSSGVGLLLCCCAGLFAFGVRRKKSPDEAVRREVDRLPLLLRGVRLPNPNPIPAQLSR
jgi:hypothetical protein